MKYIDLIIWKKEIIIEPSWEGKPIFLRDAKLNLYQGSYSLYTTFKTEIKLKDTRGSNNYQTNYSLSMFRHISEGQAGGKSPLDTKYSTRTFRELQQELKYSSETVYSNMEVWLTHISFKGKWYYDACGNMKCKKSAESFSNCVHCGHYNDKIAHRFILPIEISDYTGSVYVSAFEEFGQEIFRGETI